MPPRGTAGTPHAPVPPLPPQHPGGCGRSAPAGSQSWPVAPARGGGEGVGANITSKGQVADPGGRQESRSPTDRLTSTVHCPPPAIQLPSYPYPAPRPPLAAGKRKRAGGSPAPQSRARQSRAAATAQPSSPAVAAEAVAAAGGAVKGAGQQRQWWPVRRHHHPGRRGTAVSPCHTHHTSRTHRVGKHWIPPNRHCGLVDGWVIPHRCPARKDACSKLEAVAGLTRASQPCSGPPEQSRSSLHITQVPHYTAPPPPRL